MEEKRLNEREDTQKERKGEKRGKKERISSEHCGTYALHLDVTVWVIER